MILKNGVISIEKPKQLPPPPTLSGPYNQTCVPFLQALVKYYSDNNIPYHILAKSLAEGSHLPHCDLKTKLINLNQFALVATAATRMEIYQPFIKLSTTENYDIESLRYIIADLLIMYIQNMGDPDILNRTLDDHISSIVVQHDSMGQIHAENLSMMILQVRSLFAMKNDPNEDLIQSLKDHIQRILNRSTRSYMATTIWTNMMTYIDIHTANDANQNMSREEAISSLFTHLEMYCYNLMMNTLKEPAAKLSHPSSTKESSSSHGKGRHERDNHGRFIKSSSPQYINLSAVLDELFVDPSHHDAEILDDQSRAHNEDAEMELFAVLDGTYKDMPDRACLDSVVPSACCTICGLRSCLGATGNFQCKLVHPDKKNAKGEPLILLGVYAGMYRKEVLDASLNCAIKQGWLKNATSAEIESVKQFISDTQLRMGISYNASNNSNNTPSTYQLGYNTRIRPNNNNNYNNRPPYRSPFQDHRDRWQQQNHYGPNPVNSVRYDESSNSKSI